MADGGALQQRLGERIRKLRKARGWSQQQLAEHSDLDAKFVGGIERGERNITTETIEKISAGLALDAWRLFFFSEPEMTADSLTAEKIRDLIEATTDDRRELIWRLVGQVATWGNE
jgi:transcriptional regulator with XRE-family HTH domain